MGVSGSGSTGGNGGDGYTLTNSTNGMPNIVIAGGGGGASVTQGIGKAGGGTAGDDATRNATENTGSGGGASVSVTTGNGGSGVVYITILTSDFTL